MCLAIFVPFSSFFLGTGRTQGLIWADDPYLPHCLRLLKHWISGQMFVPLATGTSASEKNAPRNPWIIVFFFPGSSLSRLECHFFGYITVYPSFRHLYGPMRCYIMWSPSLKDESNRLKLSWNKTIICCSPMVDVLIPSTRSDRKVWTMFSPWFSPRHGEKMRLVADTGDIIKENGIIVS